MQKKIKVLISASGTGGHLIPAIQLAEKLKKNDAEIFFAAHGLSQRKIFPKDKFKYLDVLSSEINKNRFQAFFKIFKGFLKSLKLIIKYKPNVVVGFGSYHTFPVILAAFVLRKKIVLFDSNIELGKVNKLFSKKAYFLCTQFERENKLKNEILVKPLPWIEKIRIEDNFLNEIGLKKNIFTILIFGGSQGSEIINTNFQKAIEDLKKEYSLQIIHITGKTQDINRTKKFYSDLRINSYVSNFEKDFFKFYKISDLVLSRSGAASIAELICFEKPSILIPFKRAKNDHQLKNALFLKNIVKSTSVITEEKLTKTSLVDEILSYLKKDKKKLCVFKENIQKFKAIQKTKNIKDLADVVIDVGKK